jgi:hypothetical protein
MTALHELAITGLRQAREELTAEKKGNLSYQFLAQWLKKYDAKIRVAGQRTGNPVRFLIGLQRELSGHHQTSDPEILDAVRDRIVEHIDAALLSLDRSQIVRPVLDELILKVKDTKLSTLLKEFNATKDHAPNIAAIGFRTILCLVIQEIAKARKPDSNLATTQDLAPTTIINEALNEKLLDQREDRLLRQFRDGLWKDLFDLVAHKPGDAALVNKDNLSNAADALLNQLLKAIS